MNMTTDRAIKNVLNHVRMGEGCWSWDGKTNEHIERGHVKGGYATVWNGSRLVLAHRAMYEAFRGPIPTGLQIDHRCGTRSCVRPSHLEAVTNRENTLRGSHPLVVISRGGVCKRGHDLSKTRYYKSNGFSGGCRLCRNIRTQELSALHKTDRPSPSSSPRTTASPATTSAGGAEVRA